MAQCVHAAVHVRVVTLLVCRDRIDDRLWLLPRGGTVEIDEGVAVHDLIGKRLGINVQSWLGAKRADSVSLARLVSAATRARRSTASIRAMALMAISEWLLRLTPDLASTWLVMRSMAQYGIYINFVLMLFNLIPIPPLDGSHVFAYLLPPKLAFRYRQIGMRGTLIVLLLLWVTGFSFLITPLNWLYSVMMVFKGMLV